MQNREENMFKLREYYSEIEINLIIDDRPEHYAYCNSIDEAIDTLKKLKEKREELQDNYFELNEAYFRGVPGKLDLEKFLKDPDLYIFKSQKTGKSWSKEASQKIIRCRFCTHSRFGQKRCPGCKYFIKEEEVKEYEE